ncbi:MAG: HAD family hydrolase [Eubacteriales bacterium]|nr:HAD family hydrolase [Eubacteriales bacterium]
MKYNTVIFDMDGTILNTVDDLTASVNFAMEACGHRHDFTCEDTKCLFGSGAHTALQRALAMEAGVTDPAALLRIGAAENTGEALAGKPAGLQINEQEVLRIEEIQRPYYLEHSDDHAGPYDGIMDLLRALRLKGYKTAVVSNKQDPAVRKLAERYFDNLFDAALGEQPGIRRKPAPDMMESVLRQLDIDAGQALYLGDSEVDVETARNAHMDCICVSWGFRPREFLASLHPLAVIDSPLELLSYL